MTRQMLLGIAAAIALMAPIGAAVSQDAPVVRHPSDKYIAKDAPAPASNWKEQPWWAPLAECAAVYGLAPEDKDKFRTFAAASLMRVMADRKIPMEEAGKLVIPWTQDQGTGRKRAEIMASAFGMQKVRAQCDNLLTQYEGMGLS